MSPLRRRFMLDLKPERTSQIMNKAKEEPLRVSNMWTSRKKKVDSKIEEIKENKEKAK